MVSTVLLQCFVDSISTHPLLYHKSANMFPLLYEFMVPFGSFFLDMKDGGKPFWLPMTVPIRGGGLVYIMFYQFSQPSPLQPFRPPCLTFFHFKIFKKLSTGLNALWLLESPTALRPAALPYNIPPYSTPTKHFDTSPFSILYVSSILHFTPYTAL